MKTLLEQLTPETIEKLKELEKKMPASVKCIKNGLVSVNYVSDLSYYTVLDISQLLNIDITKYSNIRNLFIQD
jgi:hypothetical protein